MLPAKISNSELNSVMESLSKIFRVTDAEVPVGVYGRIADHLDAAINLLTDRLAEEGDITYLVDEDGNLKGGLGLHRTELSEKDIKNIKDFGVF